MTQVSESVAQSVAVSSGAAARILVVDDEQYMCDICTRTLRSGSHHVMATTDVTVALSELHQGPPYDLLLADIKMPTMSGLELAQRAREVDPAIAIIIMTGHASLENLHQAVRRGIADFIAKPFELEQLRLAVEQALHKRRLLQDSLRLKAVEQLLHSSEAINATLDRTQLSQIILETARQQTACHAGFLLLRSPEQQLYETLTQPASWRLLDAGYATALRACHAGQTLIIEPEAPLCTDGVQDLSCGLAVPLRAQGDIVGALLLCNEQADALRPGVPEQVTLLANHAGTALRNALLYGELQEAYQRLQEMNRLKSEFIAIASHELRTPLSIVLGYAMMVRDQSEGPRREYAQRVLESANHIKDIVDDMVNLRHLELGETTLNLELCELQELVAQAVNRMLPAAEKKHHELRVELPDEPLTFLVDREKMLLALGNLISNAIKFTPNHGLIVVKGMLQDRDQAPNGIAPVEHPAGDSGDEWVVVQVCDTGIGIPQREQARIFERFYQVADSLTREQGGVGLGLAIVRELVTLQGGIIWLESVERQGSTFSFALPYRTA